MVNIGNFIKFRITLRTKFWSCLYGVFQIMLIVAVIPSLNMANTTSWSPRQNKKEKASRTPSYFFLLPNCGCSVTSSFTPLPLFHCFHNRLCSQIKIQNNLFLVFIVCDSQVFRGRRKLHSTLSSQNVILSSNFAHFLPHCQKEISKYPREYLTHSPNKMWYQQMEGHSQISQQSMRISTDLRVVGSSTTMNIGLINKTWIQLSEKRSCQPLVLTSTLDQKGSSVSESSDWMLSFFCLILTCIPLPTQPYPFPSPPSSDGIKGM